MSERRNNVQLTRHLIRRLEELGSVRLAAVPAGRAWRRPKSIWPAPPSMGNRFRADLPDDFGLAQGQEMAPTKKRGSPISAATSQSVAPTSVTRFSPSHSSHNGV